MGIIQELIEKSDFEIEERVPITIDRFESEVKSLLKSHFNEEYVEEHFYLTDDFKKWIRALKGSLWYGEWEAVYCPEIMISATNSYYERYHELYADEPRRVKDCMYIYIGFWGDKHDYFYCCDKTSMYNGKICDTYDEHPWPSKTFDPWEVFESIDAIVKNYVSE